ncbi:MAG: HD domain-containing protein [bacterium]
MEEIERLQLETLVVAPYLQKATALIGQRRKVGGNQFRHSIAVFGILLDYHYTDPILLKAAIIHDLFEDVPKTNPKEIEAIDDDGEAVVQLALEVTRRDETKSHYLAGIRESGSKRAKILKVADRISNLTDLHLGIFTPENIRTALEETSEFVYPMALEVNKDMAVEVQDLLRRRMESLQDF